LQTTSAEVVCNYRFTGPLAVTTPNQEEQDLAKSLGLPAPEVSIAAVPDRVELIGRSTEIADCQAFLSQLGPRLAEGVQLLVSTQAAGRFVDARSQLTYARSNGFTDLDAWGAAPSEPGEPSEVLGGQGSRYRLEIGAEDIPLAGAKKPMGAQVSVLLHHGLSYSATHWFHPAAGEEYCLLKLDFGPEYAPIAACGGSYPTLVIPAEQVIELTATQVNATWDEAEHRNRISSVSFSLSGVQLFRKNGQPSQVTVTGMECFGTDMTLTELYNSWGADRVSLLRL
jgi:hypothetical protein